MYRRTVCRLCGSYHIPPLSRVGVFPIHLDPPTQQHREIFKLLLGIQDDPLLSSSSSSTGVLSIPGRQNNSSEKGNAHASGKGMSGGGDAQPVTASRHRLPSQLWYMEPFAESLRVDSQLAPLDDLILIPNTRYPISLRQSTHLAALAVLAARGIPGVHVDFTALEHPDDRMPVVYELAQRYHNAVLVHWLHDAYEMLNWRNFSEVKMHVPMLLLQTNSLPVSAVTKPPPPRSPADDKEKGNNESSSRAGTFVSGEADDSSQISLLHSRLYQNPKTVKDKRFAEYYNKAAEHIHAQTQSRSQRSHPALRRRQQEEPSIPAGTNMYTEIANDDSDSGSTMGTSRYGAAAQRAERSPGRVSDVDQLVRGEWWLTRGGRGDDRVEVSRSYSNAASSSWLGAPIPLGKKRMGIDVTADAMLGDHERAPRRRGRADVDADDDDEDNDGKAMERRHHATRGEKDDVGATDTKHRERSEEVDDDDDDDEDEGREGLLPGNTDSDFIITDQGLVEVTWGEKLGTSTESEEAAVAAAALSEAPVPELYKDHEEKEEAPSDPNEPRALFREFAEVRAALEEMMEPTQVCQRRPPRKAPAHAGATPQAGKAHRDAADATESDAVEGPKASSARGARSVYKKQAQHRVLDPNSVISRRNVRELLEEIFPSLYYARLQHRHSQRQRRENGEANGNDASPPSSFFPTREAVVNAAAFVFKGRLPAKPTAPANSPNTPAAHPSSAAATTSGDLSGRDVDASARVAAQTDALLDEVALLQQSHTFSTVGPSHLATTEPAAAAAASAAASSSSLARASPHTPADEIVGSVAAALVDMPPLPMVEVHPVTRCTGADVRQVLWEQDVSPAVILTDAVARYVESHGLYRDVRKNADGAASGSHAGAYASLFAGAGGSGSGGVGGRDSMDGGRGVGAGTASRSDAVSYPMAATASSSAAAAMNTNYGALKRVMMQKEHAVMSFPGIIPRLELHYDKNNLLAREQYEKLKVFQCQDAEAPDLIVPIGGDGYMMHCIRNNWRRFIPFYGVNAGHVGYLLNDCATLEELFSSPLKLHTTNMLYCQAEKETETGERVLLSELAFNDAWVERSSGQTALIRILINGEERIRRLRGDGVLVSTAAGSTAYSQALGASPVPVGAPLIQVVGSNVVSPAQWRPVHLDQEDQVEFEVIDNIKRPCRCFVDSVNVGNVTRMLVRSSRVAGVTLAFSRSCDLQHKLYQMQFPKTL